MLIRILARQAGTTDVPGAVREATAEEARALVAVGRAEYADTPARVVKRATGGAVVDTAAVSARTERRG